MESASQRRLISAGTMASLPHLEDHLTQVIRALTSGRLVPFLGAGANLGDRSDDWVWQAGQNEYLPTAGELSTHLRQSFRVEDSGDLSRISQQVASLNGTGPLYDTLYSLFDANYPITRLHGFLAALPGVLRAKGYPTSSDPFRRRLLFVTTNYDDLLERALNAAGELFHSVIYEADGEHRGKFFHRLPEGGIEWVERPNNYRGLLRDELPVVLKMHGTVDRTGADRNSFVITEDHYIEYLTRTEIVSLIPAPLPALLKNRHLLFLGYGLRDWNLLVILHRLGEGRMLTWKSWAIQRAPDQVDREIWRQRGIDILDISLGKYVPLLDEKLKAYPPAGGSR